MSAPVDELDVGHDPRARPPWHDWSPGRRRAVVAAVVVVLLAAGALWYVLREPLARPAATPAPVVSAPGADVVLPLDPDTTRCPAGRGCQYTDSVSPGVEAAFRTSFPSAGYIGRQCIVDDATNEVYWQLIRFSTGTLVTVTLTQQPVSQLAAPPVADDTPSELDRKNGSVTLTAVRDGYLMTANAAALPGQILPVPAVQQWLRSVPAP